MLLFFTVVKMLWTLLLTSLITGCGNKIYMQTRFTSQSSIYKNQQNIMFKPTRAFDGNEYTCARTKAGEHEFWTIDLKNVYNISCVCIYNMAHNLINTQITIGNKSVSIEDFKKGNQNCLHLPGGQLARNVTVTRQEGPVVLCEVTIWGTESDFVLIKQSMTWEHALYYCRDNHKDLASILDQRDQDWVELVAEEAHTPHVWLGLRYTCTLGFWFWIQSYKLDYDNFEKKIERCDMSVAMSKADGKWYTVPDNQTYNFICTKRGK